ncbi:MAG: iron-sulfur cluster assembly protein [Nitrosopumilus sp.]|nr:iron-sulfur cluster assembly protein [Nitrosopumilus sp.]
MGDDARQMRVKIFDELSKIVDPEINTTITELELIDEVDIAGSDVKVDLHLTSPFCPAVFGFKICQDIHDNLLKIDGIDDVKVNVSNHFMAEQINNQVNSSPNPKKAGGQQGGQQGGRAGDPAAGQAGGPAPPPSGGPA